LRRGFTMSEVILALIIFMGMMLMYGAVMPTALHSSQMANDYMQAHLVAQQKIEQIRGAGYSNLSLSSMQGLNIVDATQPTGYPISNPSGFATGAASYSFTTADSLSSYFPSGATGILTIAPDLNAPTGTCDDIYVTISWRVGGRASSYFTANTKVINR